MKFIIENNAIVGCRRSIGDNIREVFAFLPERVKKVFKLDGIYLPNKSNGGKITRIGEKAFYESKITGKLFIPNTIEVIEDKAFSKTYIEEIVFEDGSKLECIGTGAFSYCFKLKKVNFQDLKKLKQVCPSAFKKCSLTQVCIDSNSRTLQIGSWAFRYNSLEKVEILSECVIYNNAFDNNKIISLSIPKCSMIFENAFSKNNIIRLDLSQCINLIIQEQAFSSNYYLEEVVLPDFFCSIAENTFEFCTRLTPEGIKEGLFGRAVNWTNWATA